MTNITSRRISESSRHYLREIPKMTIKKWIAVGGGIAIAYLVWAVMPFSSIAAQDPEVPIPVLVAGPVRIQGIVRSTSDDVMTVGQRAVLMAINVGDTAIPVRMEIRDATNSSIILATTQKTLEPWTVEILPYIEQDDLYKDLTGVVYVRSEELPSDWSTTVWNRAFRSLLVTLSGVDHGTNRTDFVVGSNIVAIRNSLLGERTGGR